MTVTPRKGDRVRVVIEGEVTEASSDTRGRDFFYVGHGSGYNAIYPGAEHVVSVEVIPPPAPAWETALREELYDRLGAEGSTSDAVVAAVRDALAAEGDTDA